MTYCCLLRRVNAGSVPGLAKIQVVPRYCSVDPAKDSRFTTEDTTHAKSTKGVDGASAGERSGPPSTIPFDEGAVTLSMIQALIPLRLRAVEEALQQEVSALAGVRCAHQDGLPGIVRWGQQAGSIYLADQQLPITVPRVRDQHAGVEVPLAT